MTISVGSGISQTGLLFHYDMDNTGKSWKGKPTTNMFSAVRATDNASSALTHYFGAGASGTVGSEVVSDGQTAKTVTITSSVGSHSFLQFYNGNVTLTGGSTYSASAMVWTDTAFTCSVGSLKNGSPWTGYIPMSDVTLTPGWNFVSSTGSYASTVTDARFQLSLGQAPTGATIKVIKPQIEAGTPSPYVNGTRSSTEAIVDLTGNNTITADSLVYNSDGTYSYNTVGTSYITTPMTNLRPTAQITQEAWFNTSYNGAQVFIGSQYGTGSNNSYAIWIDAANSLSGGVNISGTFNYQSQSYTISTGVWYHFAHTYDGATQRLYVNGSQIRSWATTGIIAYDTNNTKLILGNDWNGPGRDVGTTVGVRGQQSVARVYSRALSAVEINQNFESARGRYGV